MAKERERIEILAACARNYLYMYGELQSVLINASRVTDKEACVLLEDNLAFLSEQERFITLLERGNDDARR